MLSKNISTLLKDKFIRFWLLFGICDFILTSMRYTWKSTFIEGNPIPRYIMYNYGIIGFTILGMTYLCIVLYLYPRINKIKINEIGLASIVMVGLTGDHLFGVISPIFSVDERHISILLKALITIFFMLIIGFYIGIKIMRRRK